MDVLLAVLGTSPAVLTETVWALAHEPVPVIPDTVVVITTLPGRDILRRHLSDEKGWERLLDALDRVVPAARQRIRFGMAADHVRLLPSPDRAGDLHDITTAAESGAAADCIMRSVREFTEDPDSRIIASIAGGRKTMGALLTSCMGLLARPQDRLCHVLVQRPYDNPLLDPPFLFPEGGTAHRLPGNPESHAGECAQIELVDIPFVRMRGIYEQHFRRLPGNYMTLVSRVQGAAPPAVSYPRVTIDLTRGTLRLGAVRIPLTALEFALSTVVVRAMQNKGPPASWYDCEEAMQAMQSRPDVPFDAEWFHGGFVGRELDPGDFRKVASSVRSKIRAAGFDETIAAALMPGMRGGAHDGYPAGKLRIVDFTR